MQNDIEGLVEYWWKDGEDDMRAIGEFRGAEGKRWVINWFLEKKWIEVAWGAIEWLWSECSRKFSRKIAEKARKTVEKLLKNYREKRKMMRGEKKKLKLKVRILWQSG